MTQPDHVEDDEPRTRRGGRRPTFKRARFTAQLVTLVEPADRDRVDALCERHALSQAEVMRDILAAGLPTVEERYAAWEARGYSGAP